MKNKFKELLTNNVLGNALSLIFAITFFLIMNNISIVSGYISSFLNVILPFTIAFSLAYVLNTPIVWFEKKIFYKFSKRLNKFLSITIVYILFLFFITALIFAIVPQMADTIMVISNTLPEFLTNASEEISIFLQGQNLSSDIESQLQSVWLDFVSFLTNLAIETIPNLLDFSLSLGAALFNTLTAIIASLYMLTGKDRLIFQVKKMLFAYIPFKRADRIMVIARRSNRIFSGFIVGKMIDSLIIGIICFIGMLFIHQPFAVLIAVIIGVTNMIPFFGPFIGAIPCAFILLLVNPMTTVIFIIFIIVLQQIDGNIIGPKILGDSTGLSAIWVLVSIIIGNGLFGLLGMLIGVPTFAVIYSIFSDNIKTKLRDKSITTDNKNYTIKIDKLYGELNKENETE